MKLIVKMNQLINCKSLRMDEINLTLEIREFSFMKYRVIH